jgi:hypothetical protein
VALAALGLAGIALRVAGARGDLWLDEIVSVDLAEHARSFLDVLTGLHTDNNHYLNTEWLRLVGDGPLAARALAIVAGGATIALVAVRTLRDGSRAALTACVLFATSYVLVLYGSEARGYALAGFFAVAGYYALEEWLRARTWGWALGVGACATAGLLSHLTFVFPLAGLASWAALEAWRTRRVRPIGVSALAAFAPPLATLGFLWLADLRSVVILGGPEWRATDLLADLGAATLGVPRAAIWGPAALALAAAVLEVVLLARGGDSRWAFFAVELGLAPALVVAARPTEYVAPRYFFVCVPFFLLLLSRALSRLARLGVAGRSAHAVLLVLFCAGNLVPTARLLRDGRGRYRDAIAYLVAETSDDAVTVGSDHDFRNQVVLAYHASRMELSKPLVYVTKGEGVEPPTWFLRHELDPEREPQAEISGPGGRRYRLRKVFPSAPLSGWSWEAYRRTE